MNGTVGRNGVDFIPRYRMSEPVGLLETAQFRRFVDPIVGSPSLHSV